MCRAKKYPGVPQYPTAGPRPHTAGQYYHEMQLLAAAGRFVFYTNPHGSDGRGQAFFDLVGRWGTIDYDDLMDFTDEVLRLCPDLDAERLGVLRRLLRRLHDELDYRAHRPLQGRLRHEVPYPIS